MSHKPSARAIKRLSRAALVAAALGYIACDAGGAVQGNAPDDEAIAQHRIQTSVPAPPQLPNPFFTKEEEYQALRLILSEDEARRGTGHLPDPTPAELTDRRPDEYVARGVSYTTDMLILLSLLSDELRAKVDAYRAQQRRLTLETVAEERDWRARRDELNQVLGANLRR